MNLSYLPFTVILLFTTGHWKATSLGETPDLQNIYLYICLSIYLYIHLSIYSNIHICENHEILKTTEILDSPDIQETPELYIYYIYSYIHTVITNRQCCWIKLDSDQDNWGLQSVLVI